MKGVDNADRRERGGRKEEGTVRATIFVPNNEEEEELERCARTLYRYDDKNFNRPVDDLLTVCHLN